MSKINSNTIDNLIKKKDYERLLNAFRFTEVKDSDLEKEQYNSTSIYGKDDLIGKAFKRFFRYKSDCFDTLKEELKNNPSCSYVTYLNQSAKYGVTPNFVSALAKTSDRICAMCEVLTSQILNYMEVPTCANFSLVSDKDRFGRNLLSIDMISENERFYNLSDFKMDLEYFHNLEKMHNKFYSVLDTLKVVKQNPSLKEQLLKDLVYSYLARCVFLGDKDCQPWNIGLLINDKEKQIKLVNFDFENSFRNVEERQVVIDCDFAKKLYPEVYEKFLNKISEIKEVIPEAKKQCDDEYHKRIVDRLGENIDLIQSANIKTL